MLTQEEWLFCIKHLSVGCFYEDYLLQRITLTYYLWNDIFEKETKHFFSDFNLILRQNMTYAHNCLLRRLEFCTGQHSNNVKELYSGIEMDERKCYVKK